MASDRRASALLVLALVFAAPPALGAPSAAERESARKLMDDGMARMKANEPLRAIDSFQKAHEIMHVPTTGVAVAKAQLAAGHLVEAREAAVDVARTTKEPGEPPVFEKARKQAREIEAQVKSRIPAVRIRTRGPSPSAVAVDGVEVPLALIVEPVPVNPGKHVITARTADGVEGRVEVEVREGEKVDAEVTLQKSSPDAAKPADKATAPTTPSPSSGASSGPPPKPKVLGFGNDESAGGGPRRPPLAEGLIWGGFGVGIIGLGIGTVTGFMTLSRASDVKQSCENNVCGPEARSDLDSANTLGTISTISVGIGLVGIGAGILGLVMPPRAATRTGLALSPTPSGVGGTF